MVANDLYLTYHSRSMINNIDNQFKRVVAFLHWLVTVLFVSAIVRPSQWLEQFGYVEPNPLLTLIDLLWFISSAVASHEMKKREAIHNRENLQRAINEINEKHQQKVIERLTNQLVQQVIEAIQEGDWHFASVKTYIDESVLSEMINHFEKNYGAFGLFICGLLLEGRIENSVNLENISCLDEYFTKRLQDAISFYNKAALCNHILKPLIDNILWEIKITRKENLSIQMRLARFDLIPSMQTFPDFRNHKEKLPVIESIIRPPTLFFTSNWNKLPVIEEDEDLLKDNRPK